MSPARSEIYTQASRELMTVRDLIRWGASQFQHAGLVFGHGTDNAWDEAAALVLWAIATPWERLPAVEDTRLTTVEKEQVVALFGERIDTRRPAAYLTGEAWFAGLRFVVDERVLVPRSPIAELIETGFQPWLEQEPARVLDLCTGSGCIGIACAYAFPDAAVDLADVSPDALTVARKNVALHDLRDRIEVVESDGLEALAGRRYDLIVCNPPYVDAAEMAALAPEFRAEPPLGLASGDDGLDFTRELLRRAPAFLEEGGLLVVEVGNSAPALEAVFPGVPFLWPEFERGGQGVFVLDRATLVAHAAEFA